MDDCPVQLPSLFIVFSCDVANFEYQLKSKYRKLRSGGETERGQTGDRGKDRERKDRKQRETEMVDGER